MDANERDVTLRWAPYCTPLAWSNIGEIGSGQLNGGYKISDGGDGGGKTDAITPLRLIGMRYDDLGFREELWRDGEGMGEVKRNARESETEF